MARRVSLEIVGDSSSLERAFAQAAKAAQRFNAQVGSSTGQVGLVNQLKAQASAVKGVTAAEEDLIKVRSRRASSIGPFRLAGVGVAAGVGLFAATQAVRELGAALEVSGEEAFTTEGRIKNMVSALTSGSLVGAVKALTRTPQTLEELGITAVYTTAQIEALRKVADGTTGAMRAQAYVAGGDLRPALAAVDEITKAAGTSNAELAKQLLEARDAMVVASAATESLNDYVSRLGQNFVTQSGAVATFKGAVDDLAGPRGPGARATEMPYVRPGMPTLPGLSPSQRRELDLIGKEGMARIPLLEDRLRQLNNQMKDFHGNQQQRLKILTNIRNTEAEIAAIYADQAAQRKQAAEEARRAAEAAREEARRREVARELRILEGPIPTRANLRKQFEQIQKTAATDKDFPRKFTEQFARVARLLKEEITPETREAINSFFETVRGEFDKGAKGNPLAGLMQVSTKQILATLAAGTGLRGRGLAALGANISGAQIPVYVNVSLDGQNIAKSVTTNQARSAQRTASQTSGRK